MALFRGNEVNEISVSDHNIMEATATGHMEMEGENRGISSDHASKLDDLNSFFKANLSII